MTSSGFKKWRFRSVSEAVLGPDAKGLSASTIIRLKATWWEEYETWRKRDFTEKRYVYIRADGIYFTPRLDGFRENADSWRDLLKRHRKRGLTVPPELATGDGALGFWTAPRDVYPGTCEQRCRVYRPSNVLGAMPKSIHEKAKADPRNI